MHVDDHHRDALVLRRIRIRAHGREPLAGLVRPAGPHLLAVDQPTALGAGSARLDAGSVRARGRLAEQLAPDQLLAKRGRYEPLHLLRRRVLDDGEQVPAGDAVRRQLDAGAGEHLLDDELLDRGGGSRAGGWTLSGGRPAGRAWSRLPRSTLAGPCSLPFGPARLPRCPRSPSRSRSPCWRSGASPPGTSR